MFSRVLSAAVVSARTCVRSVTLMRPSPTTVAAGAFMTGACSMSLMATSPMSAEYAGTTGAERLRSAPEGTGLLRVVETPVLRQLFTKVRASTTGTTDYVFYMDRLMRYLAEEGIASLPSKRVDVQTPCGVYEGLEAPKDEDICAVSIVRAGDSLAQAVRQCIPACSVGKILIQRDEEDELKRPKLFYSKLGPNIGKQHVLLCDPMVATGGSAKKAVEVIKEAGVAEGNITFLCIVAAPEGIIRLRTAFPQMNIVAGEVDLKLNDDKYIVPGLGDAGDRYFGTVDH